MGGKTVAAEGRRWGMIQAHHARYLEALGSFERYFAVAGESSRDDTEARAWVEEIRTMIPGGDLAREGLREERVP